MITQECDAAGSTTDLRSNGKSSRGLVWYKRCSFAPEKPFLHRTISGKTNLLGVTGQPLASVDTNLWNPSFFEGRWSLTNSDWKSSFKVKSQNGRKKRIPNQEFRTSKVSKQRAVLKQSPDCQRFHGPSSKMTFNLSLMSFLWKID